MIKGIRFTDEFKQDAVAQVVERGYPRGALSGGAHQDERRRYFGCVAHASHEAWEA